MLAWVRKLFAGKSTSPMRGERDLRARYDAAQTNNDNRRHWANADGLSAAAANNPDVRYQLRNRSRYEYDNGPYCNGIIRTRTDDLVGIGPTLQILTDDDALNDLIEQVWSSWAKATCFAEKLHTMDQTRTRDGESFTALITNLRVDHPVKLDLDLIEADLITDPNSVTFFTSFSGPTPVPRTFDGIEYDSQRQPVAYHVLNEHPGDIFRGVPVSSRRIPAAYMLHWFRKDRPGQLRGVPELTSALPLFPYLRRWSLAALAAAEFAASQAGVLKTTGPVDPAPVTAAPFSTIEIERGMFTELPAGYDMEQLEAKHPGQNYGDVKREILNECGRPLRMPTNVVTADSSKHNFSSAKLDHYGYRGGIRVDRSFSETPLLDRVFRGVFAEAKLLGLIPADVDVFALPRNWAWPGWPSMDKDEAKNDTERLNNGTATLADILSEWGIDWKTFVRQRGRELAFGAEQGVPPPPNGSPPPPAEPVPDPNAPPTDPKAPPPEPAAGFLRRGALNGSLNGTGRAH